MSSIKLIVVALRDKAVSAGINLPQQKLNDAIAIALYGRPYAAVMAAEAAGSPPQVEVDGREKRIGEVAARYRIDSAVLGKVLAGSARTSELALDRPPLDSLGFSRQQVASLDAMLRENAGAVLISGATGSGKSRTLYAVMDRMQQQRGKDYRIALVSEVVEYTAKGVLHVPVELGASDDSMAEAIRKAQTMDVDAIAVDESKGAGTLKSALDAARSGHMVYLTVHAHDPWDLPAMLGAFDIVKGVVGQRLVNVLCDECSAPFMDGPSRVPFDVMTRVSGLLLDRGRSRLREHAPGAACKACQGRGVVGRCVIAEVANLTPSIIDVLRHLGSKAAQALWVRRDGGETAEMRMEELVRAGKLDPRHLVDSIDPPTFEPWFVDAVKTEEVDS